MSPVLIPAPQAGVSGKTRLTATPSATNSTETPSPPIVESNSCVSCSESSFPSGPMTLVGGELCLPSSQSTEAAKLSIRAKKMDVFICHLTLLMGQTRPAKNKVEFGVHFAQRVVF